jgi:DNA-binding HxlR family transcriptional regulator
MKIKGKEIVCPGRTGEEGGAETHCPVETTINLIGGKYKSLILWKLMGGTLRFSQLRREILCATPKMLTQQLRELESNGLISRTVFPEVPPKVEYALTGLGKSIAPVLEAMYSWGAGYLNERGFEVNCSMKPFSV